MYGMECSRARPREMCDAGVMLLLVPRSDITCAVACSKAREVQMLREPGLFPCPQLPNTYVTTLESDVEVRAINS
jgi:hypothetical protein